MWIPPLDQIKHLLQVRTQNYEICLAYRCIIIILLGLIYALAFDISSKSIFFGDRNSSTLWMVSTDRITDLQDNRMLLAANVHAWGMTYDWIHKALYWTDDK